MNQTMRRYVDTHTHHTPFSHDARQDLATLLDSAAVNGLAAVMLSDHYDADVFRPNEAPDVFDLGEARREWQDEALAIGSRLGIAVQLGIEIGYQPHLTSLCRELAAPGRFDGVILSIHTVNGIDPFFEPEFYAQGKINAYTAYLDALAEAAANVPGPAIAGHLDYIVRYAPFADPEFHYNEMPDVFDRLFQTLVANDKCLEINVRSLYRRARKLDDPEAERRSLVLFPLDPLQLDSRFQLAGFHFPDPLLIRRYLELGGRMVSLASDAHNAGESGRWFDTTAAYLAACGLTALTHFEQGRPILTPIQP